MQTLWAELAVWFSETGARVGWCCVTATTACARERWDEMV